MIVRTICTQSLLGGGPDARRLSYDPDEPLRVEARAADERAVDLGLGHQRLGVLRLHAAAIQDTDGLGDLLGRELGDEPAQISVHLGRLTGCRVHARPRGPRRLAGGDGPTHSVAW